MKDCNTCGYNIYPNDTLECSGPLCDNLSSWIPKTKDYTDEEREENWKKMYDKWIKNGLSNINLGNPFIVESDNPEVKKTVQKYFDENYKEIVKKSIEYISDKIF